LQEPEAQISLRIKRERMSNWFPLGFSVPEAVGADDRSRTICFFVSGELLASSARSRPALANRKRARVLKTTQRTNLNRLNIMILLSGTCLDVVPAFLYL